MPKRVIMVIAGTNTTYLSNAINNCSGRNFRTLLNDYRIQYAIEVMTKDDDLRSIRGMHLRCGFTSVSVFYDAFKRRTGKSPLQVLRALSVEKSKKSVLVKSGIISKQDNSLEQPVLA